MRYAGLLLVIPCKYFYYVHYHKDTYFKCLFIGYYSPKESGLKNGDLKREAEVLSFGEDLGEAKLNVVATNFYIEIALTLKFTLLW
ncbi:hypothetical protein, partial [Mucilaginibacter flavidus]|uniref:hypothetical protein n=1 Tax=Mucilaginibacter flavidus TaxID=2949309 RepID=UPI0020921A3C